MPNVLVPLAQGCEELEAVTIIDLLRRPEINAITAAIYAAPKVLSNAGLLKGKKATCYPTVLESDNETDITSEAIVIDGKVITSRGPSIAMDLALSLIEVLEGKDKRDEVEKGLAK